MVGIGRGVVDNEIFEQVKGVLGEVLNIPPEKVTLESRFEEDLEIGSYDQILLVMALEDDLGIEVSDDDAANLATVGNAVEMVRRVRAS